MDVKFMPMIFYCNKKPSLTITLKLLATSTCFNYLNIHKSGHCEKKYPASIANRYNNCVCMGNSLCMDFISNHQWL